MGYGRVDTRNSWRQQWCVSFASSNVSCLHITDAVHAHISVECASGPVICLHQSSACMTACQYSASCKMCF